MTTSAGILPIWRHLQAGACTKDYLLCRNASLFTMPLVSWMTTI